MLHVPEIVHYLRTCVGSVAEIVMSDFVHVEDTCESCGSPVTTMCRVVIIRADVTQPTRWQEVSVFALGIPQRAVNNLDSMIDHNIPVWVVPQGFNVEDIDASWGVECD